MHGNVSRIHSDQLIQAFLEAVKAVLGKSGDQVHIDILKAGIECLLIDGFHILGSVGSAAGGKNLVDHSLGIDADPVSTASFDNCQFFRV